MTEGFASGNRAFAPFFPCVRVDPLNQGRNQARNQGRSQALDDGGESGGSGDSSMMDSSMMTAGGRFIRWRGGFWAGGFNNNNNQYTKLLPPTLPPPPPPPALKTSPPPASTTTNYEPSYLWKLANHFTIEFLAAMMVCYAEVWLVGHKANSPSGGFSLLPFTNSTITSTSVLFTTTDWADLFRQFLPSLVIAAYTLCLKDMEYIFPDANSMTTIVLYSGGAYTNKYGETDWSDILIRIIAHAMAALSVFYIYVYPHDKGLFFHADAGMTVEWTTYFTEIVAVAIESLAIVFLTIPLLKPYNPNLGIPGYRAKSEANPPKNSDVRNAAISLAVIHYVLQVSLRANMSFYTLAYSTYIKGEFNLWLTGSQLVGLAIACTYSALFFPADHVYHRTLGGRE